MGRYFHPWVLPMGNPISRGQGMGASLCPWVARWVARLIKIIIINIYSTWFVIIYATTWLSSRKQTNRATDVKNKYDNTYVYAHSPRPKNNTKLLCLVSFRSTWMNMLCILLPFTTISSIYTSDRPMQEQQAGMGRCVQRSTPVLHPTSDEASEIVPPRLASNTPNARPL